MEKVNGRVRMSRYQRMRTITFVFALSQARAVLTTRGIHFQRVPLFHSFCALAFRAVGIPQGPPRRVYEIPTSLSQPHQAPNDASDQESGHEHRMGSEPMVFAMEVDPAHRPMVANER